MTEMHIRVYGWSVASVENARPWTFSIGLLESFAHPELVVTDMEFDAAHALINAVGDVVRDSDGRPSDVALKAMGVELVPVAERHLRSQRFNAWRAYYGERPRAGDFVQILPPPGMYCACHQATCRRLDRV